uniref:glucuronosyltransferase n=1 Tax=Meloidogyne enterolobii TaxID=390850 RepID=A0A6V7UW08_MELEN|nr:unnamed protein product [Meloidogyne enterolobii]
MIKQREILERAQVKLFVTHGGQNSFNEILKAGVPVIVIPFFGDQPLNATIAEYLGIGLSIKPGEFIQKFQEAFNKIMGWVIFKFKILLFVHSHLKLFKKNLFSKKKKMSNRKKSVKKCV